MWRLIFVFVVAGALIATACGGSSDKRPPTPGTPGSTATAKPSTDDKDLRLHEADLKKTAVAFQTSILKDGAVNTYGYFSSDFKQKCPLDEFLALMAIVKVFLGELKDADVQVEVSSVRYEGEKALVDTTGTLNGDPINDEGGKEFPDYWVRQDGEWKVTTDDPKPCDTDTTFGGSTPSATKTPAASGPGTSRAEAVAVGTAIRAGDAEYTVLSVNLNATDAVANSSSFPSTPSPGNRYVLAHVRGKAVGSGEDTVDIGVSNFSMTGSGNKVYEPYGDNASCGFDVPDELSAKLFPGGEADGNVCIQVPRSERGLILIVEPQFSFDPNDRRYLALE